MTELSTDYHVRINAFLYDLAHQPDVDLRFLGVVMNFNESYKPTNPRRQRRREKTKEQAGGDKKSHDVSAVSTMQGTVKGDSSKME